MSETRRLQTDTGWYASYMERTVNQQGKALVLCQQKKIKRLETLLYDLGAELELKGEMHPEVLISSIEAMLEQDTSVEHKEGYFIWIG